MNHTLLQLQMQYANAIYQAARYTREAEIAKALIDAFAEEAAEAQFQVVSEMPDHLESAYKGDFDIEGGRVESAAMQERCAVSGAK